MKTKRKIAAPKTRYVIARAKHAGVFAGVLKSKDGQEVILTDARRIYYWDGAASLSQLAMEGTKAPASCKFPAPVKQVTLFEVIELLEVTPEAEKSIRGVPVWAR